MQPDQEWSQLRKHCIDAAAYGRAQVLYRHGHVRTVHVDQGRIRGSVREGERLLRVELIQKDGDIAGCMCDCSGRRVLTLLCSHAAALWIGAQGGLRRQGAQALLAAMEPPSLREPSLRLQARLYVEGDIPYLSLLAGDRRMYVVRDLPAFLSAYFARTGEAMHTIRELDFREQCFPAGQEAVLRYVYGLTQQLERTGLTDGARKRLPLGRDQLTQLAHLLKDEPWQLRTQGKSTHYNGVLLQIPPARLSLTGKVSEMVLNWQGELRPTPLCPEAGIWLYDGQAYLPAEDVRRVLDPLVREGALPCSFAGGQAAQLVGEVLPYLRECLQIDIKPSLAQHLRKEPLAPRVTLDTQGNDIVCSLRFGYGKAQIDPFAPGEDAVELIERDVRKEQEILGVLAQYGFLVRSGGAHLRNEDAIYRFLSQGVQALQGQCEVFCAKELLAMRPRRSRPSAQMYRMAGALQFRLMLQDVPPVDHEAVLQALGNGKEYVRLRNGAFLQLEGQQAWGPIAQELRKSGAEEGVWKLPPGRALLVEAMLGATDIDLDVDENLQAMAQAIASPPAQTPPIKGLRPYQRMGFDWMCAMRNWHLGGLLADEMGLGKTVQVLAVLERERAAGGSLPSVVVAPTSLLLNWQSEAHRFAPRLRVCVLTGDALARAGQIARGGYDLLILSYAQLRRDVDILKEKDFACVVLDEAQNIKNPDSLAAGAAKALRAQVRFALTGTPVENHPLELWSLMDFALPGLFGARERYLARYGEGDNAHELQARLAPFLVRRLKDDVLQELPKKVESSLMCEMTSQQRTVYTALLHRTRDELMQVMGEAEGFAKARFRILAAITRLRQTCCHPGLFLPDYEGGSGKMDQLFALLEQETPTGATLLFSQFTSMLDILQITLNEKGLRFLRLDGKMKPAQRAAVAAQFNAGECPLMLISLQAGGTGLNLTGANRVIHYDPWWNPAVEAQATDRAHRIGQERVVRVVKLLAKDSIEEKIADLQARKRQMIDRILLPGEPVRKGWSADEMKEILGL